MNGRFLKTLQYDLRAGTREALPRLVGFAAAAFIAVICSVLAIRSSDCDASLSVLNVFAALSEGCPPLGVTRGLALMLPITWLTLEALMCFMVASYPENAFRQDSAGVITRMGRTGWWFSKCLWAVAMISICFVLMIALSTATVCLLGGTFEGFDSEGGFFLYDLPVADSRPGEDVVWLTLLAWYISMVTLVLLQVLLTVRFGSRTSFTFCLIIIVLSMYADLFFLFPQMGMLSRSSLYQADALSLQTKLLICLLASSMSIVGGVLFFKKRDMMGR